MDGLCKDGSEHICHKELEGKSGKQGGMDEVCKEGEGPRRGF